MYEIRIHGRGGQGEQSECPAIAFRRRGRTDADGAKSPGLTERTKQTQDAITRLRQTEVCRHGAC